MHLKCGDSCPILIIDIYYSSNKINPYIYFNVFIFRPPPEGNVRIAIVQTKYQIVICCKWVDLYAGPQTRACCLKLQGYQDKDGCIITAVIPYNSSDRNMLQPGYFKNK